MQSCTNSKNASITFGGIFDIDTKKETIANLEHSSLSTEFWLDNRKAQETLKNTAQLKRVVEPWEKTAQECADTIDIYELASAEKDEATLSDLQPMVAALDKSVVQLEFMRKMGGEDDRLSAILSIHSGAGGTESCDWTSMLYRMYCYWLERKGYPYTLVDMQEGEEAGIKSVTLEVSGEYAFGYLKAESGVHRLVRISPFDSNARRHTSFSSVCAYPVFDDSDDFEVDEKEIRIDTYRASGAGGQHINKTDSAVRMTHIPTNIVVQCQNERSQMKNRSTALRLLKSRIKQFYKEEEEKKRADKQVEKKKIEWGSQIRSYVLHPYNMVKDHRTDCETSNTQAVLDGDIDMFIESYLLAFGEST